MATSKAIPMVEINTVTSYTVPRPEADMKDSNLMPMTSAMPTSEADTTAPHILATFRPEAHHTCPQIPARMLLPYQSQADLSPIPINHPPPWPTLSFGVTLIR